MDFDRWLADKISLVDNELQKQLTASYPESIYDAMRYSVFPSGKRIRPVILLAASEMLGGEPALARALPFAAALEMIHTYSMIHDDLPAMDDDDVRRGRPTNHAVHGEAMAILAGDGLLNRAFEVMANACIRSNNLNCLKAMALIAKHSGIQGMIGGQVMDIALEGGSPTATELDYIYTNKTAKLFMAAFGAGAYVAGASDDTVCMLENVGKELGIAFQLRDDMLDITGSATFGKPPGSDAKNNKATYAAVLGFQKAEEMFKQLSVSAIERLNSFSASQLLVKLVADLINRER